MIGALFNALAGRSDFGTTGHKIDARAGQQAIGLQLDKAGRQNAALQYSLAAGSRGAGTGLAIREAQRRAQLGMGQAAESAAIASQQLEQGVAEANQRAALQADQINQEVSLANAKNLQPLAMAGAAAAGGALSDERAKMPMGQPGYHPDPMQLLQSGQYASATAMPEDDGRRVTWMASPPSAPAAPSNFEFAPRVTTPVMTMGGPQQAPPRKGAPPPASSNAGQAFQGALMAYMSDERSKQKIMELEATNRGLTAMLHKARPAPTGPTMRPAIQPGAVSSAPITPPAMPRIAPQPAYDVTSTPSPGLVRVQSSQPLSAPEQASLDIEQQMSDYRSKMVSDERAKNAVSYLRPVHPVAYQYKPEFVASGEGDPGPQVGLLAQDLERTPIGATVVQQGADGMKRVQVPQLLMLNTAADAEQQRQIDMLKRRRRA